MTRVVRADLLAGTATYCWIAFAFTCFFCALEFIELVDTGILYFADLWNVMDWLNYSVFFLVWWSLMRYFYQIENVPCSTMCERTGYQDDWEAMATIRDGKFYLSLCVCIQLLKIIKFISQLIPKMGLAPNVLKKAFADLVFFGVVFFISLVAFSQMFFIQLGPFINDYATQAAAVVATFRALFGDFDLNEIMDNSSGYANTLLFITYLFVAVFIMLSMFFAILGESQANFRDDQREKKSAGTAEPEYGVLTSGYEFLSDNVLLNLPVVGPKMKMRRAIRRQEAIAQAKGVAPAAVDRIEARQLELHDKIDQMVKVLAGIDELKLAQANQQAKLDSIMGPSRSGTRGSSLPTRDAKSMARDKDGPTRSASRERPPRGDKSKGDARSPDKSRARNPPANLKERGAKLVEERDARTGSHLKDKPRRTSSGGGAHLDA